MILTEEEKGILSLCKINKIFNKSEITKKWKNKYFSIKFTWRGSKNICGRFGGGWNWMFGFQIGGAVIIFNLLIFTIRITNEFMEEKQWKALEKG